MTSASEKWLMQSCAIASICVALILVILKSVILAWTDSFGVQASLLDSGLDVLASIINLYAIRQALKPPTELFRFGFGKAEALAGIAQAAIISCSALWLLLERFDHFVHPTPIHITPKAFGLMLIASGLTFALVLWQRYILRRVQSLAVASDNMHFETDLFMDAGVLITFGLVKFFKTPYIDVAFGICALFFILYKTYPIFKQSFAVLMDKELSEDIRAQIKQIIYAHKNVLNMHQLRTRSLGQYEVIQCHIVLDGHLTLFDAHTITDEIEASLLKAFPKAHVIIHQDCYIDDEDIF
ncbi:MAG: Ferrous-iron efflux pump FieF [Holosporales bacterium]